MKFLKVLSENTPKTVEELLQHYPIRDVESEDEVHVYSTIQLILFVLTKICLFLVKFHIQLIYTYASLLSIYLRMMIGLININTGATAWGKSFFPVHHF